MITSLKQIGDFVLEKSDKSFIEQIIEDPNSNGKYNTVLVILFMKKGEEVIFQNVKMQEYSKEKVVKYAYKSGPPRGGDLTPTSKITNLETSFKRIQYPLKKVYKKLAGVTTEEKEILSISQLLQDKEISKVILQKLQEIKYKDNAILTIALEKDNKTKYVGDFSIFIEELKEKYEEKFFFKESYNKAEKRSIGEDNLCYICGKKADKTYGYVSTFKFYNLDKRGFTSGGFNRGDAWKNYPVCQNCAMVLDQGKNYIEENLSARFCGIDYFIIPKTIFSTDGESNEDMFTVFEDLEEKVKFSLKEENRQKLSSSEKDLFDIMQDFDNYLNFNLLFYREEQSGNVFRILLYIEDVLPSYIKRIFEVKKQLDEDSLYHDLRGKEGKLFKLAFTFDLIADFFPVTDYEKSFLEISNGIFSRKKISYKLLISRFVENLQERFSQNKGTSLNSLKAFMILQFLQELNLLKGRKEGMIEMEVFKDGYDQKLEDFFTKYANFFDSDVKRAIFLEGVLAQFLLDIQYAERNATPFRGRLNGLKINEKIIKKLLPEIQNKLEEYKKNYYKNLEKLISQYMLKAEFSEISNTEISFYFIIGMNLAYQFKNTKEEAEKE